MSEPIEILLVEDSQGDAELTRLAFSESDRSNLVSVAEDGAEALRYLRREGEYQTAKRPQLILLDLNLPGLSGHELLNIIKRDASLATIPVVVLSSSAAEQDVWQSYALHANCYLQKPIGFPRLLKLVDELERFWFSAARLPEPPS